MLGEWNFAEIFSPQMSVSWCDQSIMKVKTNWKEENIFCDKNFLWGNVCM